MLDRLNAALRGSTLVNAWSRPENQIAYGALVLLILIVGVASQVSLSPGFKIDLRDPVRYEGVWQVIPIGLSTSDDYGRRIGPTSRLVLNRPLPDKFRLQIEARGPAPTGAAVNVRVGDFQRRVRFGQKSETIELTVENPSGARDIELHRSGDPILAIASVSIR